MNSITIPGNVTSIGDYAFNYAGLTSITLENGITTIGAKAFTNCSDLTSITIPSSVVNLDSSYIDETYIENVTFANRSKSDVKTWLNINGDESDTNYGLYLHCSDGTLYYTGEDGYQDYN